jgi:hypothetical protein
MTDVQEIPVTNDPRSTFSVELDGNTYTIKLHWNITDAAWYMNLTGVTNDVVINGLKLVTGPDLLHPYSEIDLGGLVVVDQSDAGLDSDFDNFGDNYILVYIEKATLDAAI